MTIPRRKPAPFASIIHGDQPTILLAPGMGDIHWVMLRMRSFIKRELHGRKPMCFVCSMGDGKDRAQGYLERLPFIDFGGYYPMSAHRDDFVDVFVKGKEFEGGYGPFDHFLGANHWVETGLPLQVWMPSCEVDHDYPFEVTEEDREHAAWCTASLAPFIATAFYKHGFYKLWDSQLSSRTMLQELSRSTRVVLTGARWDTVDGKAFADGLNVTDMTGETTFSQLVGLILACERWVGHAAGNGMLAHHLRRPTTLLWSSSTFKKGMFYNWINPDADYEAIDVARKPLHKPKEVADGIARSLAAK